MYVYDLIYKLKKTKSKEVKNSAYKKKEEKNTF